MKTTIDHTISLPCGCTMKEVLVPSWLTQPMMALMVKLYTALDCSPGHLYSVLGNARSLKQDEGSGNTDTRYLATPCVEVKEGGQTKLT